MSKEKDELEGHTKEKHWKQQKGEKRKQQHRCDVIQGQSREKHVWKKLLFYLLLKFCETYYWMENNLNLYFNMNYFIKAEQILYLVLQIKRSKMCLCCLQWLTVSCCTVESFCVSSTRWNRDIEEGEHWTSDGYCKSKASTY
jgi:hypothetical protein